MIISNEVFRTPDMTEDGLLIKLEGVLDGAGAAELRAAVEECLHGIYLNIYIDAAAIAEADLSGINEIIHAHYTLDKAGRKLIFVYRKDSVIEKWVETTGLGKFVATAVVHGG